MGCGKQQHAGFDPFVRNRMKAIEAGEIKLGYCFNEDAEIITGMNRGESVATTDLRRLDSGTKVQTVYLSTRKPAN